MKKNINLLVFLLLLITSCASSYKENRINLGKHVFRGGVHGKAAWNQPLVFTRVTWMTYVNTVYDALLANVGKSSPYWTWLSQENKTEIEQRCQDFVFAILYSSSPLQIPHSQFIATMRDIGYEDYFIPNVGSALKSHPDFEGLHMQDAKTLGFCSPRAGKGEISLNFPSFPEAKVIFYSQE